MEGRERRYAEGAVEVGTWGGEEEKMMKGRGREGGGGRRKKGQRGGWRLEEYKYNFHS